MKAVKSDQLARQLLTWGYPVILDKKQYAFPPYTFAVAVGQFGRREARAI